MLLTAALGVLGVASGALAARVAEWQVVLIPMSAVSLALAHYFAYRRGVGGQRQRVLLWIATPVSLTLWVLPYLTR
jgi:hypothetical protein